MLQLHDELLYEVNEDDIRQVADLVRRGMETCVSLRVKLPVKLKVGKRWGEMEDFE